MAPARPVPDLSCSDSFRRAAGKIIWTRTEEVFAHRAAALGEDPEGVHDMRVATRRLRAAIEVFVDAFPRRQMRRYLRTVKDLADCLGVVRDLDVLRARLEAEMRDAPAPQRLAYETLLLEMEPKRTEARTNLEAALDRLEHDAFMRSFLIFVARKAC